MVSVSEILAAGLGVKTILQPSPWQNMSHAPVSNKLPIIQLCSAAQPLSFPPSLFTPSHFKPCSWQRFTPDQNNFCNSLFEIHFQLFSHSPFVVGSDRLSEFLPRERANGSLELTAQLNIRRSNKTWNPPLLEDVGSLTVWDVMFQFMLT